MENVPGKISNIVFLLSNKKNFRCEGVVFEAEKVMTKSHYFHRGCLTCSHCGKGLNPTNFIDASDGDIYCKVGKATEKVVRKVLFLFYSCLFRCAMLYFMDT